MCILILFMNDRMDHIVVYGLFFVCLLISMSVIYKCFSLCCIIQSRLNITDESDRLVERPHSHSHPDHNVGVQKPRIIYICEPCTTQTGLLVDVESSDSESREHVYCSICLDIVHENTARLECDHTFHLSCIESWLNNKNVCPLCIQ